MKAKLVDMTVGLDGRQRVTLSLVGDWRAEYDKLHDAPVDVEIKKHREKRSLDANSYMWAIVGKIAEALKPPLTKDEAYIEMLRKYGQGGMVSVEEKHVEKFRREYKYCDEIGRSELKLRPEPFLHGDGVGKAVAQVQLDFLVCRRLIARHGKDHIRQQAADNKRRQILPPAVMPVRPESALGDLRIHMGIPPDCAKCRSFILPLHPPGFKPLKRRNHFRSAL